MDPQIIDYYNEMPSEVNVIEKMNEELSEVQKENDDMKQELHKYSKMMNRFKMPRIKVNSSEEYKEFEQKLEEFGEFVNNTLEDNKIPSFGETDPMGQYECWWEAEPRKNTYISNLTNKLDELTNHQNIEWCKYRIQLSIEIYLQIQDDDEPYQETFRDLVFGLQGGGYVDFPSTYIDISSEPDGVEWRGGDTEARAPMCIHNIPYYNCEKCGELDDYGEPENYGNRLLCINCQED